MADAQHLTALGLGVTETGADLEATLQLGTPLLNPLARRPIASGVFALAEDLLIPVEPPELVGLPPLSLTGVESRSALEQQLAGTFHTHLVTLQRWSAGLRALGIASRVDAESLDLSARLEDAPFRFVLAGDKQGRLRVTEVARNGEPPVTDVGAPIDLADFPNRDGLLAHLRALLGSPPADAGTSAAAAPSRPIDYRELLTSFGDAAWVPAAAALDVVVTLRVRGTPFRFAATRVSDRTFRALLAGPVGKVWAEQFELETFPGVASVVALALGVPVEDVELVGSGEDR